MMVVFFFFLTLKGSLDDFLDPLAAQRHTQTHLCCPLLVHSWRIKEASAFHFTCFSVI